jgi:hypothetical protein
VTNWTTIAIGGSIPWAVVVIILVYLLKNPDKAEKWYSMLARAFSGISSRAERSAVAREIESDINDFAKKANGNNDITVFPYDAKIKWVTNTNREAFIRNDKMVIRMQHHENQARNFLYATMDWVSNGTLPETRHLIHPTVQKALEFSLINSILVERKRHDSRQLFIDEIYDKEAPEGSLVRTYTSAFTALDSSGILMGVILPEYASFAKDAEGAIADDKLTAESIGFATMLLRLSNKKQGVDVSLDYKGNCIRCSIVLVARTETYNAHGLEPYIKYINKCPVEGYKNIYVIASGEDNFYIAKRIKNSYEKSPTLSLISETVRKFRYNVSIVLHYKVNPILQVPLDKSKENETV